MKRIEFKVQGAQPEPYTVTFINNEGVINALCTCEAGKNGIHCKHRVAILEGVKDNVISNNIDDIREVVSWLPGTILETTLNTVKAAEKKVEKAKKELSLAKKDLSAIMYLKAKIE